MKHRTTFTVSFIFLSLLSCDKKPAPELSKTETKQVSQTSSKYEGDWIFVGLAHPWHYGDRGCAGVASIRGTAIDIRFILSPAAGLHGSRFPWSFIAEGKSSVYIKGQLTTIPDSQGFGGTQWPYRIAGTDTVFDGMPIWTDPGIEHSILIGGFDPPLMFRSSSAPPIVMLEPDDSIIIDDPFADPEDDPFKE